MHIDKRVTKNLIAIILMIIGILFLSQRTQVFPYQDFIEYWSAGKINLSGGNPYSPDQMIALQNQITGTPGDALMMWNPPWALAFAMPVSLVGFSISRMLWFLLELLILTISADLLWQLYQGNPKQRWIAWLVVLSFGPTLHTLKIGQITPLLLLGSVGFLYFLKKDEPFLAGLMASLVSLKPHLLYLFIISLFLWLLRTRNWKLFFGFAVGIILPFLIASLANPHIGSQYLHAIIYYPPEDWKTATLGMLLRTILGQEIFFLQFVPSVVGVIWLFFYWFKKKEIWDFQTELPLLIMISVVTTSYGWAFDVLVVIIAIVDVLSRFNFNKWALKSIIIFSSYGLVSILNAFLSVPQHWFWWLSSFYLLWYIVASYWHNKPHDQFDHA